MKKRCVGTRLYTGARTGVGRCFRLMVLGIVVPAAIAWAGETTVQNDSLIGGGTGNVQAGFVAGESAAAWLTSPCDGTIVAVQVFWRSVSGTTGQSLEDSISIFADGPFPTPGALLEIIEGPVMTDGVINEFRFLDDNQTIPLNVPITSNEEFVVSFKFLNTPGVTGASVVTDFDGCQSGKNSLFAIPGGWFNSCILGVSGDFVIRAVIDCDTSQACCFDPEGCLDLPATDCVMAAGIPLGPGTSCATTPCFPSGACCNTDGTCSDDVDPDSCSAAGGTYQGDDSLCSGVECPDPVGACCLESGGCLQLTEVDCAVIPNSTFVLGEDCTDADSSGTADACESSGCDPSDAPISEYARFAGCACDADVDLSGTTDAQDAAAVEQCVFFSDCSGCVGSCDVNCDGLVNAADVMAASCRVQGCSVEACCTRECIGNGDCNSNVCVDGYCRDPKLRYVSISPGNAGAQVALRVTQVSSGLFPAADGESWWVQDHDPGDSRPEIYRLGCTPFYQDWSSAPAAIQITGEQVVPDTLYRVEAVALGCPTTDPASFSDPFDVSTTVLWGDVVGFVNCAQYTPSNGAKNFDDIQAVVFAFQGLPQMPFPLWADIDPQRPNGALNLSDAQRAVQAFQGASYPFSPPPTCP